MEDYLSEDDDVLTLAVPPAEHVEAGLRAIFGAVPLGLVALWFLYAVAAPATGWALLAAASIAALYIAAIGGYGLARVLRASSRSDRSRVRIDLGERLIYRAGAEPKIFRTPEAVVVSGGPLRFRLSFRSDDGTDTLLRGVSGLRRATLVEDAQRLADALGVRCQAPSVTSPFVALELPHVRRAAHYFPLLQVSLPTLLTTLASGDEPEDRFAARQSGALYVLEALVLGLVCALVGLPALLFSTRSPALALLAFLCPLGALWIVRTALRLYASHRALRGERVVFFLLGWLARPPVDREDRDSLAPLEPSRAAPYVSPPAPPRRRPANATAALGSLKGQIEPLASAPPVASINRAVSQPTDEPRDGERSSAGGGWWR